jgi:UDP-N-acetylglucosamine 2-epimerase (non-hydrolysing)
MLAAGWALMDVERLTPTQRRLRLVRTDPIVQPPAVELRRAAADEQRAVLIHAIGERSSFLRVGPIVAAVGQGGEFRQHVVDLCPPDSRPDPAALHQLGLPRPGHDIAPGDGGQGARTARMLAAFERVLLDIQPAAIVLAGNVDATLAAALAAAKLGVPVAHLESGLRTGDWGSGEEINRVVIDRLSDILFVNSAEAEENLHDEGIADGRTHYVGNTMVDWLRRCQPAARMRAAWTTLGLAEGQYVLAALQKRATVDGPDRAARLFDALELLARRTPVVLPVPPRMAAALERAGLAGFMAAPGLHCIGQLAFVDFLSMAGGAGAIVTDSGSVQEEASALGVPCFTLRNTTERAVTLTQGTNVLLGEDPAALADVVISRGPATPCAIERWDGHAGERVAEVLGANFALRRGRRRAR